MIQTSTNSEQSARLLACGLSPYTADMTLSDGYDLMAVCFHHGCYSENSMPAWSLSVLIAFLPMDLTSKGLYFRLVMGPTKKGWEIEYNDLSVTQNLHRVCADNPIEAVVRMIERLTSKGIKLNQI